MYNIKNRQNIKEFELVLIRFLTKYRIQIMNVLCRRHRVGILI